MKRKRLGSNIYNLSIWKKTLVEIEVGLERKIPPLLVIVLIQNGVLESVLQALVRNEIEVIILGQKDSGSVLYRKICVRNKLDGLVIMHAKSKIKTNNIPIVLLDRIVEGKKGIGSLIETLRIETFRHIKKIGFDRRQRAVYRIYDIYIRKQPAITIKEYFPIDLPLWNS